MDKNHPEYRMFRSLGDVLCGENTGCTAEKQWGGDRGQRMTGTSKKPAVSHCAV